MKLVKSLLLAAPATLVAVIAQAADLPSREAAPIQYVRICDAYGAGFFFIPGTDTCLRVGGYLRAEYQYTPGQRVISPVTGAVTQAAADQDTVGIEVRGRIDLDARTQTQWGTVQTVVWLRGGSFDGIKALSVPAATSIAVSAGAYVPTTTASSLNMERAYIRFAGITAGLGTDNFTTMPPYTYAGIFAGYPVGVKELAYTATFGGGFSATIAIESRADTADSSGVAQYSYVNNFDTGYNLVGNVRYDGSWGYLQVAGELGNNSYRNNLTAIPNSATLANQPTNDNFTGATTQGAYAIGASARIKMPWTSTGPSGNVMVGPGSDNLLLTTAYGHGILAIIGCSPSDSSCGDPSNRRWLDGVLRFDGNLQPTSAAFTGGGAVVPGSISFGTTDAWAVGGIFTHYWSPQWRSNFAAEYEQVTPPRANASVGLQLGSMDTYQLAASLIWTPVVNFDIGVEAAYDHNNQTLQNPTAAFIAAGSPGLINGNWAGRLRLERQF